MADGSSSPLFMPADGYSSPLFMPQRTSAGNVYPSKRGNGSTNGNGNANGSGGGSGNGSIKSEQGTPEPQSNLPASRTQNAPDQAFWADHNSKIAPIPGANMEPEVKDERSPSPPRPFNPFSARGRPTAAPKPFAPLISRAERKRRKAAIEEAKYNNATPDHAIVNTALESASQNTQTGVGLGSLAARDSAMHNPIATNPPHGDMPTQSTIQANAAPRGLQSAPPPTQPVDTRDLVNSALLHLNALAAKLRKDEHEACDREEHLATMLEQAREVRACAIRDRSNGLVVIRARKRKLDDLEMRLLNGEAIDPAELVDLVEPLRLEVPVDRAGFVKMRVEGKGREREDGYESDLLGSG